MTARPARGGFRLGYELARRLVVAGLLAAAPAGLVAACTSHDAPAGLPSPSRQVVVATSSQPAAPTLPPTVPAATPRTRFQALVGQWQGARTAFVSLVLSGRPLTLQAEHTAAQVFLRAERTLHAAMDPAAWPARSRTAVLRLRRTSQQLQSHLTAMAQADSTATFTERLADYSVDVASEDGAIRAVDQSLAR